MFRKLCGLVFLMGFVLVSKVVCAGDVAGHAPTGVMADHLHKKGEWMASYRYMYMDMPQNYSGAKKVSVDEILNSYMMAPVQMDMQMHMVGLMYGVADEVTAMLMLPYVEKNMTMRGGMTRMDSSVGTRGLGDVELSGLFSLKEVINAPAILNFGVSLPSGSINQKGDTMMGSDQNLPYPMQLGSGTVAILPGLTYADKSEHWSWGAQQISRLQIGENEHDYRLGNQYEASLWGGYTWADWISSSVRAKGSIWRDVKGVDPRLNPMMTPTADAGLKGGERVDMFIGVNLLGQEGLLHGHRLSVEVGHPVYQQLDGPQLGAGLQGTIAWEKAW